MRLSVTDLQTGVKIPAMDVIGYLRAKQWKQLDIYTQDNIDRLAIWSSPDDSDEVYVPLRSEAPDYSQLLAKLLNGIARFENRSPQQVLDDVRSSRVDIVRVCRRGARGQISLADGSVLFSATAELLSAAASAAVEARPAYQGRRARKVQDFVRQASFGQTETGSFTVKVLVPLPPYLPGTQIPLELPEDSPVRLETPFHRRVTETLLRATGNAYQAASRASLEQSLEPFSHYVETGVSADLCKALSMMLGDDAIDDEISVSVNWARSWEPVRAIPTSVVFAHDVLQVLAQASKFLSDVELQEAVELVGYVIRLHKERNARSGEVTIHGRVYQKWWRVKVTLAEDDYSKAVQAHERDEPIAIMGDLRKEGRRYVLERPHRVRLANEGELDD